jgi:hypothetical protein
MWKSLDVGIQQYLESFVDANFGVCFLEHGCQAAVGNSRTYCAVKHNPSGFPGTWSGFGYKNVNVVVRRVTKLVPFMCCCRIT